MKVISSCVVAGIAAAALVTLAPGAHADSSKTVMVRPGDFVPALSDVRSSGHEQFLKEGLHVWTDDNSSNAKVAEYVAVPTQGLPGSASLTWYGTQPQASSQIVFDADGNKATTDDSYNILVGEPVYGHDFWMSTGSDIYKNHHDLCPETTGGSGSDCHGTLAEWQQAFPDASMYAVGFSLGSGIQGDGVIHDLQVGDTDFQFTSEPATTTVPVTGRAVVHQINRKHATTLKVAFTTDHLGAHQVQGKRLTYKVSDNNDVVYRTRMGSGESSHLKLRFVDGTGKHVVRILSRGVVTQRIVVRAGR